MSFLKTNDFAERQKNASAAKLSIIDKFKTASQNPDPAAAEKAAARAEIAKAREIRVAEREAARKVRQAEMAEEARKVEALAAEQRAAAAEAELQITRDNADREVALLAEQKAARDARYAARKAAKKERRKG
ncbi:MAG: hypothetical protein JWN07_2728 [Hyphomicrobiales bacterium]|nr:hypothetical protein [Hyphomicrobiales bacterium]